MHLVFATYKLWCQYVEVMYLPSAIITPTLQNPPWEILTANAKLVYPGHIVTSYVNMASLSPLPWPICPMTFCHLRSASARRSVTLSVCHRCFCQDDRFVTSPDRFVLWRFVTMFICSIRHLYPGRFVPWRFVTRGMKCMGDVACVDHICPTLCIWINCICPIYIYMHVLCICSNRYMKLLIELFFPSFDILNWKYNTNVNRR